MLSPQPEPGPGDDKALSASMCSGYLDTGVPSGDLRPLGEDGSLISHHS